MKITPLLLVLCLFAPGLHAAAPHPSVLRVKYKGQMLNVVRVHGDNPYVMIDGQETLVRAEPVYFLESAAGYSHNFVQAPRGALGGQFRFELIGANTYDSSSLHSGEIDVDVPLTAQKTIKGGFMAVVMFTTLEHSEIIVHEIPELPAGKTVRVKLAVHALPRTTTPLFFAQIFDETGQEVLTSDPGFAWGYYAARDRVRLASAIKKYREQYPAADHDAVPFFTANPVFNPTAVLPSGEVTIVLSVLEDGTVSNVDAGMIGDDRARASVIDALGGWLFLPKLKAGQPESTFINVPLQF